MWPDGRAEPRADWPEREMCFDCRTPSRLFDDVLRGAGQVVAIRQPGLCHVDMNAEALPHPAFHPWGCCDE
jgi:hypothetical protein